MHHIHIGQLIWHLSRAWSIWKERNNKKINGVAPTVASRKDRFKSEFQLLVYRTKPEVHPFINNFVASL
jgi:hypothetical protein